MGAIVSSSCCFNGFVCWLLYQVCAVFDWAKWKQSDGTDSAGIYCKKIPFIMGGLLSWWCTAVHCCEPRLEKRQVSLCPLTDSSHPGTQTYQNLHWECVDLNQTSVTVLIALMVFFPPFHVSSHVRLIVLICLFVLLFYTACRLWRSHCFRQTRRSMWCLWRR